MGNTNLSKLLANLRSSMVAKQNTQNNEAEKTSKKETLFDGAKSSNTSTQVSLNDNLFEPDTQKNQTASQNKSNSNSTNLSKLLDNIRNAMTKVTTSANYEGNKTPSTTQIQQIQPKPQQTQTQTPVQNNNQQQNVNNNVQNNSTNTPAQNAVAKNNSSNLSNLLNNLRNAVTGKPAAAQNTTQTPQINAGGASQTGGTTQTNGTPVINNTGNTTGTTTPTVSQTAVNTGLTADKVPTLGRITELQRTSDTIVTVSQINALRDSIKEISSIGKTQFNFEEFIEKSDKYNYVNIWDLGSSMPSVWNNLNDLYSDFYFWDLNDFKEQNSVLSETFGMNVEYPTLNLEDAIDTINAVYDVECKNGLITKMSAVDENGEIKKQVRYSYDNNNKIIKVEDITISDISKNFSNTNIIHQINRDNSGNIINIQKTVEINNDAYGYGSKKIDSYRWQVDNEKNIKSTEVYGKSTYGQQGEFSLAYDSDYNLLQFNYKDINTTETFNQSTKQLTILLNNSDEYYIYNISNLIEDSEFNGTYDPYISMEYTPNSSTVKEVYTDDGYVYCRSQRGNFKNLGGVSINKYINGHGTIAENYIGEEVYSFAYDSYYISIIGDNISGYPILNKEEYEERAVGWDYEHWPPIETQYKFLGTGYLKCSYTEASVTQTIPSEPPARTTVSSEYIVDVAKLKQLANS